MTIRWNGDVFFRNVGEESLVWCPRTGGCTVMRSAKSILDEVTRPKWRSVDEIIRVVVAKVGCEEADVAAGVKTVIAELVGQRFVEVRTDAADEALVTSGNGQDSRFCHEEDENWMPLGDFYARHGLPSELHMDLTDGCNEKCVHCYLPKGGSHYIETDVALKVLKEFRDVQGLTVYVSGGECMLHKDFAKILRYAKSLDLNIIVMSNLTLCDERMVALLKEIDPQFVNVSLYAVTESIHDSITQLPGSCRKTKAAIDALQAAGVHIRIASPFMSENRGCVDELKTYAAQRHVHLIPDNEIFGQIDHSCANQTHALSTIELAGLLSSHKGLFAKECIESALCLSNMKVCGIGDAKLNLDADGRYYPCDGFHGAIIGDARTETLWRVWTGEALNKLRTLKNKDFGACATCVDRAWCKVCPMRNFNETGNMFTHASGRCEETRLYRRIFEEK